MKKLTVKNIVKGIHNRLRRRNVSTATTRPLTPLQIIRERELEVRQRLQDMEMQSDSIHEHFLRTREMLALQRSDYTPHYLDRPDPTPLIGAIEAARYRDHLDRMQQTDIVPSYKTNYKSSTKCAICGKLQCNNFK